MPRDVVGLDVYRRGEKLFVCASAVSASGIRKIELLPVVDDLASVLETAERIAVAFTDARPRATRFDGHPEIAWSVAGASSWRVFMKGLTKVGVHRKSTGTELGYWVPSGRGGLTSTVLRRAFGKTTTLSEIADAVMEMFATADRKQPRISTIDDLDTPAPRKKSRSARSRPSQRR